jgi:NTE family protein
MAAKAQIGLVLAGGGVRGAYEVGALSALAPALEARGERPRIIVGTSVGALNGAYLAANAERPLSEAVEGIVDVWRTMEYGDVLRPLLSVGELGRLVRYLADVVGLPVPDVPSLLDAVPLAATLERLISFEQLAYNVAAGRLSSAAVVATSYASSRSVVFHHGGLTPPADAARAIDYAATALSAVHVRASAAIPALFGAVEVTEPPAAAGWYGDGGTRLNAPLKPALALGANRVVVIALNSSRTPTGLVAGRPDVVDGVAQLLQTVLADDLAEDVATLAQINETLAAGSVAATRRRIPYILVAPEDRFAIGRLAMRVYERRYAGVRSLVRSPDVALLGRIIDGSRNPVHGELLSYLFFAREFIDELIKLGRRDAERWLAAPHDEGPWQHGRMSSYWSRSVSPDSPCVRRRPGRFRGPRAPAGLGPWPRLGLSAAAPWGVGVERPGYNGYRGGASTGDVTIAGGFSEIFGYQESQSMNNCVSGNLFTGATFPAKIQGPGAARTTPPPSPGGGLLLLVT